MNVGFRQRLEEIEENRTLSPPLPRGVAPFISSTQFRVNTSTFRPKAQSFEHLFSTECSSQQKSQLRAAANTSSISKMISLGTARPAPEFYPWQSINMHTGICGRDPGRALQDFVSSSACESGEEGYDLAVAMNYGYTAGSPQLIRFVTEHVELFHKPPYEDWETILTCGSTSAIEMAFRIFCDKGDWILVEECTYPGTISTAKAQGLNLIGVKMDQNGLLPEDLDEKLRDWNPAKGPKPFLLYMIPSGQNPTNVTQSTERRKSILQVANYHDLYIVEDDPYFFLQLDAVGDGDDKYVEATSTEEYLCRLPNSYLSLDKSGRVLRLDTTSKILAPGLRCGWITGCSQVIEKFLAHTELSTLHPSGASQVMIYKLLDEKWGHAGFVNWLHNLSQQYTRRCRLLLNACSKYLPSEASVSTIPTEGMFVWLRVDVSTCPMVQGENMNDACDVSNVDVEDMIYQHARQQGVLVSKGSWFHANSMRSQEVFLRLTFAAAAEDVIEEAIQRLGSVLRAESVVAIAKTREHVRHFQAGMDAQQGCSRSLAQSPAYCGSSRRASHLHSAQIEPAVGK